MLDSLKRLVTSSPWAQVQRWAHDQKMAFHRFENDEGFGIDGVRQGRPLRMAWGAPERAYMPGAELRMRLDMGVAADLQMLLLCSSLSEKLSQSAFERFTQTNETMIEEDSPEEMRWLVMFPAVSYQAVTLVQQRLTLVSASPLEAAHWVEGPLAQRLEQALGSFLAADPAFLLMVINNRVYLRLHLPEVTLERLMPIFSLFDLAVAQALQTMQLAKPVLKES